MYTEGFINYMSHKHLMKIINNLKYSKTIQKEIMKYPQLDFVLSKIGKKGVYLLGGGVRDPLINLIYNKKLVVRDFDFFIDDLKVNLNLEKSFANFSGISYSRFGNLKIKFKDIEVDLVPFSKVSTISLKKDINLKNILNNCDLTTSSIAYSLENEKIYSCFGFDDILKKEIGFLKADLFLESHLCRIILHERRLGFSLKESAKNFIKNNYFFNQDEKIIQYLKYKKENNLIDIVLNRLKNIKNSFIF